MIQIHYFAGLREQLGLSGETLEIPETVSTVDDLVAVLKTRGPGWEVLGNSRDVLIAVNQEICPRHTVLQGNEEVAFFPPMTGG